jgi:hypothetical protein
VPFNSSPNPFGPSRQAFRAPSFRSFAEGWETTRKGGKPRTQILPSTQHKSAVPHPFALLRKGGKPRTQILPSTQHKSAVPHPFALFAKGWETTNPNPPFNSTQKRRAPSFRAFAKGWESKFDRAKMTVTTSSLPTGLYARWAETASSLRASALSHLQLLSSAASSCANANGGRISGCA